MTRVRPTSRVRQRRLRIASAVRLVQRVLGRRLRELNHHDKAIRAADLYGGVIGAQVGDAIEAAFCDTALRLLSRPTSHQGLVVAGTFLIFVDEDMRLRQREGIGSADRAQ
jgi:hypothetical protein